MDDSNASPDKERKFNTTKHRDSINSWIQSGGKISPNDKNNPPGKHIKIIN